MASFWVSMLVFGGVTNAIFFVCPIFIGGGVFFLVSILLFSAWWQETFFFYFTVFFGEMTQFDNNIFRKG